MRAMLLLMLVACDPVETLAPSPDTLAGIADEYCRTHPQLPCGKVYACEQPAENKLGRIEICIPQFGSVQAAEAIYGICELSPDPRFDAGNLCWWCCGEGCGAGCNAYSGCFCP